MMAKSFSMPTTIPLMTCAFGEVAAGAAHGGVEQGREVVAAGIQAEIVGHIVFSLLVAEGGTGGGMPAESGRSMGFRTDPERPRPSSGSALD
jgi:hypothetical protein